ncbi:SDR family oxidoreductase [Frankia sp. Ag45/Mut15]|uniref:SDR family oxidoreductase n=1 Tax=Frankia umida TaxID=573489 RepID=A0ABT0K076_9ACTN|nr:SDR family oxidoreductase [Frankia umida]MCK9876693.1 SDR family oxidoreductase [Frankia umida]
MAGRIVVVTGSSRGIGRSVAIAFAARGDRVVVNSRSDTRGGAELVREIESAGGQAVYVQADVGEPSAVEYLFDEVRSAFGPVDVLVNNAGLTVGAPFLEATAEHWLEMIRVNFLSTVFCATRAAKEMAGRNGVIINTSSVRGFDANGREGVMAYSAAKAAVNNFTRTLAKDLAPEVRVNAVAPGFVATSYMDRVTTEQKEGWLEAIPLREFIDPAQIADAYLFIADSPYLTGTILSADAGFTLGRG